MAHCDENLQQLYQAILVYREKNGGHYPATLQELVSGAGLDAWALLCPAGGGGIGGTSYVYRGAGLAGDLPKELIIAYDKVACHKGRRNILFADGRVLRPKEEDFEAALERDKDLRE